MNLFDNFRHDNSGNVNEHKSTFHFINHSSSHGRVRDILETWFKDYPSHEQHEFRRRFRSDDEPNHEGAFFELFLHAFFRRLGCSLDIHPKIDGTNNRPDFRVCHEEVCFYLEATSVGQPQGPFTRNRDEEDVIRKLIQLKSPHFDIAIDMNGELKETVSKHDVCGPFKELLNAHEPGEVRRLIDQGGRSAVPSRSIYRNNWRLEGRLVPIDQQGACGNEHRRIRVHPAVAKRTDVVSRLRRVLKNKSRQYSSLDGVLGSGLITATR